MQTLRSQEAGGITAMSELIYITETGEQVRERDRLVEVGLSPKAQAALGEFLQFQPPKVGQLAREGERLFVVEGTMTAAEFYAPASGLIIWCALPDAASSTQFLCLIRT
jgi:glycine cleavage system H lipoate-binding protein